MVEWAGQIIRAWLVRGSRESSKYIMRLHYTQLALGVWFRGEKPFAIKERAVSLGFHNCAIRILRAGQEMLTPRKLRKDTVFRSQERQAGMDIRSRLRLNLVEPHGEL